MLTRELALCFALSGLTAIASAQTVLSTDTWTPASRTAQTTTVLMTITQTEITFQNGTSLPLARGRQMLFRPEAKAKKVMADLFRLTSPDDLVLENGTKLCQGKPVVYLIVWKSEKNAKEADPRTLAPFSGQNLKAGSPDDCGRYAYDASPHSSQKWIRLH